MPVNFVELRNPYAEAINLGTQGFLQGRKLRQDAEDRSIANAYRNAQMRELDRKTKAFDSIGNQGISGFIQDPISGRLLKDPNYFNPAVAKEKEQIKAQAQFDAAKSFLPGGGGESGMEYPPGTTLKAGPLSIPLNQKLTGDEQSSLATLKTFEPQKAEIDQQIKSGVLNSSFGNIGRTVRQWRADSPLPLLTAGDPKLQALQSNINSLRRYAFGEGGKNLTGTEKQLIDSLIDISGKSDEQISTDHSKALEILKQKNNLILGGSSAAKNSTLPKVKKDSFNTPEEADASGLPKGSVVMVQGRRYQI